MTAPIGLSMADRVNLRCAALLLALLCPLPEAWADGSLPRDVTRFVQRRDMCDHLRGEVETEAAIARANAACAGTDRELRRLKHRYRQQAQVLKRLAGYEDRIEAR